MNNKYWGSSLVAAFVPLMVLLAAISLSCIVGYFVVQGFGEFVPFRKIISKSTQLFLILSIFPAMAYLHINKAELGFTRPSVFFKQLLIGLGLGLITLMPILILQYGLKINVLDEMRIWTFGLLAKSMAISLGVALLISLIEEPLFRGILLVGLRKKLSVLAAILLSSFYYAALHFLNAKTSIPPQDIQLFSGFILLAEAAGNLLNPEIGSAFCALFMVGLFLGVVRTQVPSSLGLCIGCHTAWVWQIKMSKQVFNTDYGSDYLYLVSSYDGVIGPLVTVWLLLAVGVFLLYRRKTTQCPTPKTFMPPRYRSPSLENERSKEIHLNKSPLAPLFLRGELNTYPTPKLENPAQLSYLFKGLSAVFAFLLWGGWAYYVNASTSVSKGLSSGLMQGTASFIITLVMVQGLSWFVKRLPKTVLQLPLAALLTVSVTGSCLVAVHLWVGTPNIFATIAPALTVAFIFCWYTAFKLQKM